MYTIVDDPLCGSSFMPEEAVNLVIINRFTLAKHLHWSYEPHDSILLMKSSRHIYEKVMHSAEKQLKPYPGLPKRISLCKPITAFRALTTHLCTLKTLSIKRKLMLIMMVTSCTPIFLMAFLIIANQAINSQQTIQQQLITLADVLGTRSTAALTFDDPATGIEILSGLALKSNIICAIIQRANGDSFAVFGDTSSNPSLESSSHQTVTTLALSWLNLLSDEIHVNRDIYLENDRIGSIRIVSNMDQLHDDLQHYLTLVAIMSVLCFSIAFLICSRLQKLVSDPIVNLQKAMNSVSEDKDYSLRVETSEENELGALINGFNHMLEQVQIRDTKLAEYSTHLEKIIATRTLQLTDANKKRILWLETMARFLRHELKNASVGIKTSLDLIERRTVEAQNIGVYLARARKSMASMNALLQSAGDASNLEASLYKEARPPLDWSATVMSQIETYAAIYPNISIMTDCQPGIRVLGNEIRLNQLLDNLISNAVGHCNDPGLIEVSVKQHHGKAQLLVKNQGDTLPKDKKTMFALFVSLRTPERKTNENFGLGLYIVKLIVESHGGYINARDLSDKSGVVFEVTLPIVDNMN